MSLTSKLRISLEERSQRWQGRWHQVKEHSEQAVLHLAAYFSGEKEAQQKLEDLADRVLEQRAEYSQLSDQQITALSGSLKERVRTAYAEINSDEELSEEEKKEEKKNLLSEVLPEAYGLVYESIIRSKLPSNKEEDSTITALTRQQVKGGIALAESIIDMKTGEGKTLTALLPAYLQALGGEGVHVHTVNEYLAYRDYRQAQQVMERLGIKVGITLSEQGYEECHKEEIARLRKETAKKVKEAALENMVAAVREFLDKNHPQATDEERERKGQFLLNRIFAGEVEKVVQSRIRALREQEKRAGYEADITYGYHGEFAFDYLRDNTKQSLEEKVNPRKRHGFALIDEIDNILIDDGQTPHILSDPVAKIHSDEKMCGVRGKVLELRAEQQRKVQAAEETLKKLDSEVNEGQTRVISSYAQRVNLTPEEIVRKLRESGNMLEVKAELQKVEEEKSEELGRHLYRLRHMTASSETLEQLMDRYRVHFFRYAHQKKEEREKLVEDLDYIIEEHSVSLTEKGIEKIYGLGLTGTRKMVIDPQAIREALGKEGSLTLEDYKEFLGRIDFPPLDRDRKRIVQEAEAKLSRGEEAAIEVEVDALENIPTLELMGTFMRAIEFFQEGKDYLVREGQVIVIDRSTHRPKLGTRYSKGIHEALECLHEVKIKEPSMVLGTVSLQKYFGLYGRMVGMSGSVLPVAAELREVYSVDTIPIEPSRPVIRKDQGLKFYLKESIKDRALLSEIFAMHRSGRPVLLGVKSVYDAQRYAALLAQYGIREEHLQMLTAQSALEDGFNEAGLIQMAGQAGMITIATNMAGRGTDIKLSPEVRQAGGLHVIISYLPQSVRGIKQFTGRAGRLGDPGSSALYTSLEDEAFSHFQGTGMDRLMRSLGQVVDDDLCEEKFAGAMLERAVNGIFGMKESAARAGREVTLKYDVANDALRRRYYGIRDQILEGQTLTLLKNAFEYELSQKSSHPAVNGTAERAERYAQALKIVEELKENPDEQQEEMIIKWGGAFLAYGDRQWVLLQDTLETLREGAHLRAYGQRKPEAEYIRESDGLYREFERGCLDFVTEKLISDTERAQATSFTTPINFEYVYTN